MNPEFSSIVGDSATKPAVTAPIPIIIDMNAPELSFTAVLLSFVTLIVSSAASASACVETTCCCVASMSAKTCAV